MAILYRNVKVYCNGTAVEYPVFEKNGKRGTKTVLTRDEFGNEIEKAYDRKNKLGKCGYVLSSQARRKIKNVLLYRFYKSKKNKYNRMKFFTFTVQRSHYEAHQSSEIADQYYIKKLSMCLENLKQNYPLYGYVWVAEKTKAGIIHFHCIFDCEMISALDLSIYWGNLCGFGGNNSVHLGFEKKPGEWKETRINSAERLIKYIAGYVSKNQSIIYGRGYGMDKHFSDTFEKTYKTFEGGSVGMNSRQYDIVKYSELVHTITILDDGLSAPICAYIYKLDYDMNIEHFFPEIWQNEGIHRDSYVRQEEIFA